MSISNASAENSTPGMSSAMASRSLRGSVETLEVELDPHLLELVREPGPDTSRDLRALESAMRVDAGRKVEHEGVLQHHRLALHAEHLCYRGDAPGAVPQACQMDDQVNCRGDL